MIAIGSDHGGFLLKKSIIKYLDEKKIKYIDAGSFDEDSVDYPIYAKKVVEVVLNKKADKGLKADKGILICSTGIGISIAANRYKGIRAAICHDVLSAKLTREHNDANILVMGAKIIDEDSAKIVIDTFLNTGFSNDKRHNERIALIDEVCLEI